jgi:hypothetical protein
MALRSLRAGLLALPLLTNAALAHGGVSIERDLCVLKIGPNTVHFAGYQPAHSFLEFCEDIPYVGQTIIVLDLVDSELRSMKTEVRVVRDPDPGTVPISARVLNNEELAHERLEGITEAYMPPSTYPNGTVTFEHEFKTGGQYIGIVRISNDHGQEYVSQFPFMVGPNWRTIVPFYVVTGLALAAGLFVVWKYGWRRSELRRGS